MLPKYKYLLTYRFSEIIHDLTVEFCNRFLAGFDFRRTREQMVQAARSGKQNIVEGVGQSATSKKGEIKLLGVAYASFLELISDYEDFCRQRKLSTWPKNDPRIARLKTISFKLTHIGNLGNLGDLKQRPVLPPPPEEAANFLLTLCHQATYLLSRQIVKAENDFVEKGGFSENLFKRRLEIRSLK